MVCPISHRRLTLTGNVRGRPRLFGRGLIMQVEEAVEFARGFEMVSAPPPQGISRGDWNERERKRMEEAWRPGGTRWRDATWQDQLALAAMNGKV